MLVPAGLVVVPALALGWLALRSDDDPPPRRPTTSEPVVVTAEPEVEDDVRRPPPSRRKSRPSRDPRPSRADPDDIPAPGVEEPFPGEGASGPMAPVVGETHPAHGEAVDLLAQGDYAGALEKAELCLAEAPEDPSCFDDKVRALLGSGDAEAARELAASCSEERPDDGSLCMGASVLVALDEGNLDAARDTLEALEKEAPASPYTVTARAQIFDQQGDEKMARVNYTLACVSGHKVACNKVPGVKKAGGK